jgi:putative transposase
VIRTYQYRLYPTPAQEKRLEQVLEVCRNWYNMCLAERKWAWETERRNVTRYNQQATSIHYRRTFKASFVLAQTLQSVCGDIDKAFKFFFHRVKSGKTPGYPRFKARTRFNSFEFPQYGKGAKIDGRRLRLFGIGRVRARWSRPIEGKIKTVRIKRKAGHWYASFACEIEAPLPLPQTGRAVGVDVGITSLITTSDGDKVEHPAFYRKGQAELRRNQRKLARAQRGSNNYKKALSAVQRQRRRVANQRKDYLHKISRALINTYDAIAIEDLRVANMARNRHLSKSIMDSGWSMFRDMLTYKAESAGRQIAFVDPAYTSKCCSRCGAIFPDFDLSTRWVKCACGLSMDRDHNAAINILARMLNAPD